METIKEFVIDQALIIIPVLYIIGTIINYLNSNEKYDTHTLNLLIYERILVNTML